MQSAKRLQALCVWAVPQRLFYSWWVNANSSESNTPPLFHKHKHLSTKFLLNSPLYELSVSLFSACLSISLLSFPSSDFYSIYPVCVGDQTRTLFKHIRISLLLLCSVVRRRSSFGRLFFCCRLFNLIRTQCLNTATLPTILSPVLVLYSPPHSSPSERQQKRSFDWSVSFPRLRRFWGT